MAVKFAYRFEDFVYNFAGQDTLQAMEAAPFARLGVANAAQLEAVRQASRCTGSS